MRICPLFFSIVASLTPSVGRSDIAPTQFVGAGITPVTEASIRMEAADVLIKWGTPCELSASFTMVNDSTAARTLAIGFPMPTPSFPPGTSDRLSISFDAEEATVRGPFIDESNSGIPWQWYRCRSEFPPGPTLVEVAAVLRASRATPFAETIRYCVQTGGEWAGRIGSQRIAIRFPTKLVRDQIIAAKPDGYRIDGESVHWAFRDIEPVDDGFDVEITYVRPEAMRVIANLRSDLASDPLSSGTAIQLAKHLLALGHGKSNSGFPPWRLKAVEFDALLGKIEGAKAQEIVLSHYRKKDEGLFEAVSTEWTDERRALIQILADAGYRDERSELSFITQGEELLLDLLDRDPRNSEAWNVYLANYWRFSFAAVGHWFGPTRLGKHQLAAIKQAAENCPDDECIRLWLEVALLGSDGGRMARLKKAIEERGFFGVDFPSVMYGYY